MTAFLEVFNYVCSTVPGGGEHLHTFLLVGEAHITVRSFQQSPQRHCLTGTHIAVPLKTRQHRSASDTSHRYITRM